MHPEGQVSVSRFDAFGDHVRQVYGEPEPDSLREELTEGLYHVLMTGHASCTHPACEECRAAVLALAKSAMS